MVEGGDADEHPDIAAVDEARGRAGIFDGPPRDLQQHPLLRIHQGCLTGGDTKGPRIKGVDVSDMAAPPAQQLAGGGVTRLEKLGRAPAVLRRFGDGVAAFFKQLPE